MLIDAIRIVARETGFIIVDHALGFTALRESDDRHLLFCLATGEWSIFNGQTAQLICGGYAAGRAVEEYLAVLDDAAFGAATEGASSYERDMSRVRAGMHDAGLYGEIVHRVR